MSLKTAYDLIAIINLPHRSDRRRGMAGSLRLAGLNDHPNIQFVDAVRADNPGRFVSLGAHGCFISHRNTLQLAASNNQSLLILEDDCDFIANAAAYDGIGNADIFYGGGDLSNPDDPLNSDVIGCHCMGFTARAAATGAAYFTKLLDPSYQPNSVEAPPGTYDGHNLPQADGAYVWMRRAHPELVTSFALPPIAVQRPSSSDITPGRFDRVWGLRQALNMLRKFK